MFLFNGNLPSVFFVLATVGHLRAARRSPGPLNGPVMFLGHCEIVRDCVWLSGDSLAAAGAQKHVRPVQRAGVTSRLAPDVQDKKTGGFTIENYH